MTQGDDARIGLRERKKRETRVALSRATIGLCVQRGWDNVTVEDIAATANVSVRTFRNYFSGKAEAIAAGHLERMLCIADSLRARPATEPLWDSIAHAVRTQFVPQGGTGAGSAHDQRWTDGLRLMLAEPALQGEVVKANASAQEELAKAVAERTGTDVTHDVYPKLVAAVIGAGSAVAVEHCLRADPPTPLAPVLREVFERIAAGLPAS
ncbi:TetR family transcriptional regulator [Streptomyces sp. NBC_01387]|uniref:acyl-CoA-like ligand-binding transcription factor n=1 Tax=unclassified Streptomyces TaxID=2593676 RepID=UPI0020251686|nr:MULTISPECIES: TetR family transcriptional regulator [unclassified Streptomyces]MCX4552947.1 TetR family transcriptional regulator [Streptomyces sp. NBC_01500]WSC24274.1 TetR family transcriptional regulator [Streptomyces sp. NBC_01766]WSV58159.1 TetR family transcriptional regulator [Streptomyces sp. NBC_01014]